MLGKKGGGGAFAQHQLKYFHAVSHTIAVFHRQKFINDWLASQSRDLKVWLPSPSDQFPPSVLVSARVCALRPVPSLSVSFSPCLCPQTSSLPHCQFQPVSVPSDQFPPSVSVSARVCALRPVPSLIVSFSPCLCPQTSSLPQCQFQPVSVPSDQFPPSVSVSARVYVLQVMKDKMGNTEVERRASYYEQPWCDEAVPRYFYAKVSHSLPQQLVSQEMNMGALRPPASCFCSLPITHTHTHIHTLGQPTQIRAGASAGH